MPGATLRPNLISTCCICVNAVKDHDLVGEIYNPYIRRPIAFSGIATLLEGLEKVINTLDFPQAYEEHRTFRNISSRSRRMPPRKKERSLTRYMDEQTFETKVGKQATFIVQIQFRQNATWQGTITWSEKKKIQHFRSTLEMIKLMDDAIEQAKMEDESFGSWEDAN